MTSPHSLNTPEAVELAILTHEVVKITEARRKAWVEEITKYPFAESGNNKAGFEELTA